MSQISREDIFEEISNWSTSDVLSLLRKNGLDECCVAVANRQIDGDELLHLTESKLTLWKKDLSQPTRRTLWEFVNELNQHPEKFVVGKSNESHTEESLSDTGSWDTEFDDDDDDDVQSEQNTMGVQNEIIPKSINFRDSLLKFQQNEKEPNEQSGGQRSSRNSNHTVDDSFYANCGDITNHKEEKDHEKQNTYANYDTDTDTKMNKLPEKNVSKLHSRIENSMVKQLQEQFSIRNTKKPEVGPKPEKMPRESFLHNVTARAQSVNEVQNLTQTKMSVPPPPEPKRNFKTPSSIDTKTQSYPKPPKIIQNLDLLANVPLKTEESDDDADYEPFDEIIQQQQIKSMSRAGSKQSLMSGHQSSLESVYRPSSIKSYEEEEEDYIYESIREAPEDNGYYLQPITKPQKPPPPLPNKPSIKPTTPSPTTNLTRPQKNNERSPDKKSATLPHSGSNTSLATDRATRPLPPRPDRQSSFLEQPWFHNVTRQEANALIREAPDGHPTDGYFLIRPSSSNPNNPLTLVIWYKDKVYNVPVRKRDDNRYALGSYKEKEESFLTVEEIVSSYTRNELLLSTGGVIAGSTKLTNTPPK
ncbi:lymphocyte cytosolic protein 2 [Cephus cinctus]|uniref:Lymphocyte cytosolic protein 2 n=1 Tax=Cephus cinctus TaxID=211228 RepID=A0AAJ7C928_CEPCN|nr:lymphocyte cytosolic protein 2 [Cephus cinctus]